LQTILSTGSPLLLENFDFVYQKIKKDVQLSSISGGTDIIACFALGNPLLPVYRDELQSIGLGMKVEIFNNRGEPVREEKGELVCTKPFPSMPIYFWNDPDKKKYHKAYFEKFPNVWAHGDYAKLTEHNGLIIYGRSDATLKPHGIRLGTAEIYREVEKFSEVMEAIAVGQDWDNDVRVILFVKLREQQTLTEELKTKIKTAIKEQVSPHHVPAKIIQVPDIPRTVSGKIVELAVHEIIHNRQVENMEALANPESLEFYKNLSELQDK
jgi:acetoacetyl-CoA synthetase